MDPDTLLLIFSDLDGTLLDHGTYDFSPAIPALARLKRNGAEVVLSTSKTWPETEKLQAGMGLTGPVIVENGVIQNLSSALQTVIKPKGSELCRASDYDDICDFIAALPDHLRARIQNFSTMTEAEVAAATGLSIDGARGAKHRAASEPFTWTGSDAEMAILTEHAHKAGLAMTKGGRFYHLHKGQEKSQAADTLTKAFRALNPDRSIMTIALGDAPNDFAMLAVADRGYLIHNPHNPGLVVPDGPGSGTVQRTEAPGPTGWAVALQTVMDELSFAP